MGKHKCMTMRGVVETDVDYMAPSPSDVPVGVGVLQRKGESAVLVVDGQEVGPEIGPLTPEVSWATYEQACTLARAYLAGYDVPSLRY
jgi:hypothetical protein